MEEYWSKVIPVGWSSEYGMVRPETGRAGESIQPGSGVLSEKRHGADGGNETVARHRKLHGSGGVDHNRARETELRRGTDSWRRHLTATSITQQQGLEQNK